MTIIEWFDPANIEHLRVFWNIEWNGGRWPENFYPTDIQFPACWTSSVNSKIATYYMKKQLGY